jgi:hypothetical protein
LGSVAGEQDKLSSNKLLRYVHETARYNRVHGKYSDLITCDTAVALRARCMTAGVSLSLRSQAIYFEIERTL